MFNKLLAILVVLCMPSIALARYDAQLFKPALGSNGLFTVETGDVNDHLELNLNLTLDYAYKPLVIKKDDGRYEEEIGKVIEHRGDAHFYGALGIWDFFELGVAVPLVTQGGYNSPHDSDVDTSSLNSLRKPKNFVLGDVRVVPKLRLININDGLFSLAVLADVVLPTGKARSFAGERDTVVKPALAASTRLGKVRLASELGYIVRKEVKIGKLRLDDELAYGAAVAINVADHDNPVELVLDVHGRQPLAAKNTISPSAPLEADVGVKFFVHEMVQLQGGVGVGVRSGYNAPVFRVFAGLGFMLDFNEEEPACDCPSCPPSDYDHDGIFDEDDACVMVPEDFDGHQDEDGCPDDNDLDGVSDLMDLCPETPEEERHLVNVRGCTIDLAQKIMFKFDSDELKRSSYDVLDKVVLTLEYYPNIDVKVVGHTDSTGPSDYNMGLSKRRAASVKEYLLASGISLKRLDSAGFGEEMPIQSNATARGRAANRRVEFLVITIEEVEEKVETQE